VLDLVNLALVDLALGSRVEERLPIAFLALFDDPPTEGMVLFLLRR
jgi:hypothetical protein